MGARENKVETYLKNKVKAAGGISRKWVSPGHDGVTDQIIRLPHWAKGVVYMIEIKTDDGRCSSPQLREQTRLSQAGCNVVTLYGEADVDVFFELYGKAR